MNHICAPQLDVYRRARRNMQLVDEANVSAWITYLPPPAMTGHIDLQHICSVQGQRQHTLAGWNADNEQCDNAGHGQEYPATDNPAVPGWLCLFTRFGRIRITA